MKTLKEFSDFLHSNGYEESFAPYTFLDGGLEIVEFVKNDFHLDLYVKATKEFSEFLSTLDEGTEYQVEYENYIVTTARIESPICNVSNFLDGTTDAIELVAEPNDYNKHTLDLFEKCIEFQKTNLLEHELFIMTQRLKHLTWAKENLVPLLEKYDYYVDYDSFFDTKNERCSSNIRIDFKHPNRSDFIIEVDCLTGEPIIWADINGTNGVIILTDKIYGKNKDEVYNVLLEEVWKKCDEKFGYIYSNDPHETIDSYSEIMKLIDCLYYKRKSDDLNFELIPERCKHLVEQYNNIHNEQQK